MGLAKSWWIDLFRNLKHKKLTSVRWKQNALIMEHLDSMKVDLLLVFINF